MDKSKNATINPKNDDDDDDDDDGDECFRYSITAALNYRNINNHPLRISNLRPFIDNYNWKDIEFPSHSKDWKKFEQNNKTIALNILFVPSNTKQIRPAYLSKYNNNRDNQVILLVISNNKEK